MRSLLLTSFRLAILCVGVRGEAEDAELQGVKAATMAVDLGRSSLKPNEVPGRAALPPDTVPLGASTATHGTSGPPAAHGPTKAEPVPKQATPASAPPTNAQPPAASKEAAKVDPKPPQNVAKKAVSTMGADGVDNDFIDDTIQITIKRGAKGSKGAGGPGHDGKPNDASAAKSTLPAKGKKGGDASTEGDQQSASGGGLGDLVSGVAGAAIAANPVAGAVAGALKPKAKKKSGGLLGMLNPLNWFS